MKNMTAMLLLLTVVALPPQPAFALTPDHGSDISNADGTSRFSDPDDQFSDQGVGTLRFGAGQPDGSGGGSFSFGVVPVVPGPFLQSPGTAAGDGGTECAAGCACGHCQSVPGR